MQHTETVVIGGVDAHTDAHHAAALDQRGALLGTESFPTTTRGYGELLDWLRGFGPVETVAVESTGAYAAGLVRYLRAHAVRLVEVNQSHAHTRRRRGKSDPIDAEMAARLFLAGKATAIPKRTDRFGRGGPGGAQGATRRARPRFARAAAGCRADAARRAQEPTQRQPPARQGARTGPGWRRQQARPRSSRKAPRSTSRTTTTARKRTTGK